MSQASKPALQVLFLSADTGGGHRASAESLAAQFQLQYPGSTYTLMNVLSDANIYSNMEQQYKTMSAHPVQWRALYYITNTSAFNIVTNVQMKLSEEPKIREKIKSYNPDVVVSVHPLMNNVPIISCKKIGEERGKPLPFFTVVTDLGSGHCQWFANQVEKIFVASEQIKTLAKTRGKVPDEKFVDSGLPIRHDFAVEAGKLGDRMSEAGREYQESVRTKLGLPSPGNKTVLVMGGGEGVGSLSSLVDALYAQFVTMNIDANILVVCGRNEQLKKDLEERDWDIVMHQYYDKKMRDLRSLMSLTPVCFTKSAVPQLNQGCFESSVTMSIRRILSNTSIRQDSNVSLAQLEEHPSFDELESGEESPKPIEPSETAIDEKNVDESGSVPQSQTECIEQTEDECGHVNVVGLGFVTNMAEYMVAADVLVTKAGPGTIAEAASLSLPVMLTNFLPGQEEGNVDFVVDGAFGSYVSDSTPSLAAEEVAFWLQNEEKLKDLSNNAKKHGKPNAAADIVKLIGDTTVEWMNRHNEKVETNSEEKKSEVESTSNVEEASNEVEAESPSNDVEVKNEAESSSSNIEVKTEVESSGSDVEAIVQGESSSNKVIAAN